MEWLVKMKHLKLFESYENIDMTGLIRAWLSAIEIDEDKFVINPDWSISTDCPVEIPKGFITKIPIKFKAINIEDAYFHCQDNNLKTLENSPESFNTSEEGGEIVYSGNPCWNDENQLKWLCVDSMLRGFVYNYKNDHFRLNHGWYDFVFSQKIMDDYWDEQLKKEPTIFQHLKINSDSSDGPKDMTMKSNHVSEAFYKKHMNLFRSKNLLWHIK